MNNIFVYIELENGAVADVSLELLTKGRKGGMSPCLKPI